MPEATERGRIETVHGRLDEGTAAAVRDFWSSQGALQGEAAERRLAEVVCVLFDEAGAVAGVNSAFEAKVELIGGRRFWVYRSFLLDRSAEPEMINAAFDALAEGFDREGPGPIGLVVPVGDRDLMEERREPIWEDTDLLYAGYIRDGRQARVRYFHNAVIGPGLPNSPTLEEVAATDYSLPEGYRVEAFEGSSVTADDVLALWEREGVVPAEEARRRVDQVLNVVTDRDQGLVGLSTAYVESNSQLRLDLWYFRSFVAEAHRHAHIAAQLHFHNRDLLERWFVTGEDARAAGVAIELENEGMKRYLNLAVWPPTDCVYIGDTAAGDPVLVHYFPGARVPLP